MSPEGGVWNGIMTPGIPGMAAQDPSDAEPEARQQPVTLEGTTGVLAAGGVEPTLRRRHTGNELVTPDDDVEHLDEYAFQMRAFHGAFIRDPDTSRPAR